MPHYDTTNCAQCGQEFTPKHNTKGLYCSRECYREMERVRSLNPNRLWDYLDKSSGCWVWTRKVTTSGYGNLRVVDRNVLAHRYAYELTYGPIPDGLLVLHHCDNRRCARPDHLFLGTAKDNSEDMIRKGRAAYGTRNGKYTKPDKTPCGQRVNTARLTEEQVKEMRESYAHGHTSLSRLAYEYDIDLSSAWAIIRRKNWKHI